MKRNNGRRRTLQRSLFVSAFLLTSMRALAAATLYSVTDLGSLPYGGNDTYATGLNNAGQVVGYSSSGVFLYSGGRMTELPVGTFAAQFSASVTESKVGINDAGQVTGGFGNAPADAFIYSNGQLTHLGGEGSFGHSINNAGQVTGGRISILSSVFLYSNGQFVDLGINGTGYSIK